MAKAVRPGRVKLISSVFSSNTLIIDKVACILGKIFGGIDFRSPVLDFTHTEYYGPEMGYGLKRIFLGFKRPLRPEIAYKAKIRTNAIEKKFSKGGRRLVNIDPGYIDASKLVLFSTKDYTHRIPMPRRIFAEVTLFYKDKRYNPWPWTYPDYASEEYIKIFESMRNLHKEAE